MEYIKILKQTPVYLHKIKKHYELIKDELITIKEFYKMQNKTTTNLLKVLQFKKINISKNKTCIIFGCRQEKTK